MKCAVLGDGKLGLLIALVLHAEGYSIDHYGRHRDKLRISSDAGVPVRVADTSAPADRYSMVVDATGKPEGLRSAVAMVEPQGIVVMKSTIHGEVPVDAAPIIVDELTLVGSRCGRMEAALPLLERGAIPAGRMIAGEFPLREAPKAFARAAEQGVLKILLRP